MLINGLHRILDLAVSGRRVGGLKPAVDLAALPMSIPWPQKFPRDYDQGRLSACGPNALAELYQYRWDVRFSRLFSYYFTRSYEKDKADDGVTIGDLLLVAHELGMPLEADWPYDPDKYDDVPPLSCLASAQQNRVLVHDQVVDLDHLLFELANGQPVLCGIGLPASIEDGRGDTATTGIVPVPSATNPLVGRHAVNAVTYDRVTRRVQTTHHWGKEYGDNGTLWLPFEHFTGGNVADMRAIRRIGATT